MPRVDDHLVEPETSREEMVRGQRIYAAPAKPPHAERHAELDYVIRAYAAPGYIAASDLLTRVGPRSDFATDTSLRRVGIDPATQTRYLEELAFEVVSEQSLRQITVRAEDLSNRGVRRLIAIFVKQGTVREWSREQGEWVTLPIEGVLEDPTLVGPVPIRALLDAVAADNAVIDALDSKGNPRFVQIKTAEREEGLEAGRKQGLEAAIAVACQLLEIPFGPAERAQLEPLDSIAIQALLGRLRSERRWPL